MKILAGMLLVAALGGAVLFFSGQSTAPGAEEKATSSQAETALPRLPVMAGTYALDPAKSTFEWAGKKPLIEGYTNSGTIGITTGSLQVTPATKTGTLTLDMNTLRVGLTAKKPGSESKLEEHLKGERFFNVSSFPTATFVITKAVPVSDHDYAITGNLTMKGITNEISFPATIYNTDGNTLRAMAQTEIDRTKWGITAGSGNFFQDLGDNLIDDMVALSFSITAVK